MAKLDLLPHLINQFAPNPSQQPGIEEGLRRWIANQADAIRDLCPAKKLRCFARVINARSSPHLISVEFAAPDDSNRTLLIHTNGRHDLGGNSPHTVDLAAGLKLLALLADELGVAVRLQP